MNELQLLLTDEGRLISEFSKTSKKISESVSFIQDKFIEYQTESMEKSLFYLGFVEQKGRLSPTLNFWHDFSAIFIEKLRLTENLNKIREKVKITADKESFNKLLEDTPFFQGSEYLNVDVLNYYWKSLLSYFKREIKTFDGNVEYFFHEYTKNINLADQIYFHLVENQKGASSPFAFLATYSAGLAKDGRSQHKPLRNVISEYAQKPDKLIELLGRVYKVADGSTLIKNLLKNGELFYPLSFTSEDAFLFLNETELYEDNGILCRIPNWWKGARKGISISGSIGNKKKSLLSLESMLDFNMQLSVAGENLTLEEAKKILEDSNGLTLIKGKWVAVDKNRLKNTLEKWEKLQELINDGLTFAEAMRFVSGVDSMLPDNDDTLIEVEFGEWIRSVLEKMHNPKLIKKVPLSGDFKTALREYQQHGLNWLGLLGSINMGACLADDMGLGKTVQVIALLNYLKSKENFSSNLLVVPASLIHNWVSEVKKFSPNITVAVAHPSGRELYTGKTPNFDDIRKNDIVLTTYGMVKTVEWLKEFNWNYLVLDEAQAIKNPLTAQSKAVKSLKCKNKIALTGTPIENNLGDLWSLFDFLNPGLLGSRKEFKELIQQDNRHFGKIRKIITPYMLRRLKTDKRVITDLPDKIEMDVFANLSKKQGALYQDQVNLLQQSLDGVEGIKRKGLVLSSLMKFKQICNHPSQHLGDESYKSIDSGKFIRLKEICETVKQKRERILIFTQFKEIIDPLNNFLAEVFERPGLTLHGGTAIKKRRELVNKFQSDAYYPFFILSLKAGGTGLNLTKANHVVHFDRWWNPAVENQATDRAFRIGQKKSVVVHKFICEGTFEEKIDEMLKDKTALSKNILSDTKSSWITEMNDKELVNMFSMGRV
jgi:SNF2 family DNA or RNA helicase